MNLWNKSVKNESPVFESLTVLRLRPIGARRFRILGGGARSRILGGGPRGEGGKFPAGT